LKTDPAPLLLTATKLPEKTLMQRVVFSSFWQTSLKFGAAPPFSRRGGPGIGPWHGYLRV